MLNSDDWGFGYFKIDATSIKVFESKLSKVEDPLDRAVIINNFTAMMRQLDYPSTRMPLLLNQLLFESNVNLLSALDGALLQAKKVYLPPETIPKFNKEVASILFKKAAQDRGDERLQLFCVEKAL